MYKESRNTYDNKLIGIINLRDGMFIPLDPVNSHYQEYLKWLDGYEYMMTAPMQMEWVKTSPNGNTPLPADE